jgi:uncharacterized protein
MAKMNPYLIILGLLIVSVHSYGASFNCAKASVWVEKVICSDPQLSGLDELLMASYKKALSSASHESTLKTTQRTWLESVRNACKDVACLKQTYTSRLAELNEFVATPSKSLPSPGEYERYDSRQLVVTMSKYQQIQDGMSYQQVVQFIGNPGKQVGGQTEANKVFGGMERIDSALYQWFNPGGSYMEATFLNNKLYNKSFHEIHPKSIEPE